MTVARGVDGLVGGAAPAIFIQMEHEQVAGRLRRDGDGRGEIPFIGAEGGIAVAAGQPEAGQVGGGVSPGEGHPVLAEGGDIQRRGRRRRRDDGGGDFAVGAAPFPGLQRTDPIAEGTRDGGVGADAAVEILAGIGGGHGDFGKVRTPFPGAAFDGEAGLGAGAVAPGQANPPAVDHRGGEPAGGRRRRCSLDGLGGIAHPGASGALGGKDAITVTAPGRHRAVMVAA